MGWIADLLAEIPTAARYKVELEKLASEHGALKTENAVLQSKLEAAHEKIRELEKEIQGDSGNLPEVREKLLQALAHGDLPEDELAKKLGIGREAVRFHAEEMAESKLIYGEHLSGMPMFWGLEQKGRKYLMARGLLK